MTDDRYLLLFPGGEGEPLGGWLRISGGAVVARGRDVPAIGEEDADERIVAVAPGPDVAIHWVDLPDLSQAQAAAAARLLAADVTAEPIDQLHIAVGPADADGARAMALVSNARMGGWVAALQGLALDPDHVVPETLLIPQAETGVRRWARGDLHLVRGDRTAFAAEATIADALVAGPVVNLDDKAVEAGLATALASIPVDLRQGPFVKRRPWAIDWRLVRRLAWMVAGLFLLTLLIQAALILRYTVAADSLEREVDVIASKALPRVERIANAPAQLNERLAELRGGGRGFSATAAALFAGVRDTANVELTALRYDRDGSLRATVSASAASDIAALQQRIAGQGFIANAGEPRSGGGRQIAELAVRGQ
ncbi:type II secretion system protein L (GspL) [Sphingomonas laterariae]|uniref:Type II secretion system protein L (GspL) n=1 Tax=Edaphosphingomonas laterariae TaxID=861865 RepID=A0A239BC46_9SPHN|nr:type II secretion system protein GspL [Sphingomonas laterariae]SNS04573.1 type II secretion system protein L (GspL) [Sphingomonas laterariae]